MKFVSYKSTCKKNRKKDTEGEFRKESSYCRTIDMHTCQSQRTESTVLCNSDITAVSRTYCE